MINWRKTPFIRLLVPFICGVIFSFQLIHVNYFSLFIVISILLLLMGVLKSRTNFKWQPLYGIVLNFSLFFVGIFAVEKNSPPINNSDSNQATFYHCTIVEPIKEKANTYQLVLSISEVQSDSSWVKTKEKVLVYVEKDSLSAFLTLGNQLLIKPNLKEVSIPKNPEEFNYKNYLQNKSIYRQGYLSREDWELLPEKVKNVYSYANNARLFLLSTLKENGVEGDQFAIASALIVGSKDDLDFETKQSYATAGAMHVLAVSGLHVGIVFLILNTLLSFLDTSKKGKYIKAVILLCSLWIYALITGLSPSVLRAATMLSFVIIGVTLNRKSSIYNTLAASAFLLLFINPNLLFEVGFQLSYVAVIGIVYLQPLIYKKIQTKWWLLDKIWAITAVSIAAQIATLPLTLYYFHQFPTYFMLSNLIVIPAAVVILGLGILLFITSPMPVISESVGWILNKFIQGLNFGIKEIENLPNSLIEGVSISILECVALYLIIFLIIIGLKKRRLKILNYALLFAVLFVINDLREDYVLSNTKSMIVYHINKNQAIDFIDGTENTLLANTEFINSQQKQSFHVKANWASRDLNNTQFISTEFLPLDTVLMNKNLQLVANYSAFFSENMVRIGPTFKLFHKDDKMKVDYVLMSNNSKIKLKDLYNMYDFKKVIVDGSNSKWNANRVVEEAKMLHIPLINTENGAFVKELYYSKIK